MSFSRNFAFDGMRGIAAILVLLFHVGHATGVDIAGSGYLAVDFFFVLSGYVIERAYAPRLAAGMPIAKFVETRLIRLYPLFLAGALLGFLRGLGAIVLHDPRAPLLPDLLGQGLFNLALLPAPGPGEGLFPINTPAWSLSLEVAVNMLFAVWLFRARSRTLLALCLFGAIGMVMGAVQFGRLDLGWGDEHLLIGIYRTLFGFTTGILIARHVPAPTPGLSVAAFLFAVTIVIGALVLPVGARVPHDLVFAFLLAPLCVIGTAGAVLRGALARLCGVLGDLSYPIYAIHYPLILPLALFTKRLDPVSRTAAIAVAIVAIAFVAAALDEHLRARIAARLKVRQSARTSEIAA